MYLIKTYKKFIEKDGSKDLFFFLLGLVGLFSFAFIYMQEASRIFTLGSGVLLSALFSYITRDEKYFAFEEKSLDSFAKLVDYTLSKNIFTILFICLLFFVVFLIGLGFYSLGFTNNFSLDFNQVVIQALLVLGIENIFILLSKDTIKSYDSGFKRNVEKDIHVGLDNYKNIFPSLLVNIFLIILIYYFKIKINIIPVLIFYLTCLLISIGIRKNNLNLS